MMGCVVGGWGGGDKGSKRWRGAAGREDGGRKMTREALMTQTLRSTQLRREGDRVSSCAHLSQLDVPGSEVRGYVG